jgi:nitroreductase
MANIMDTIQKRKSVRSYSSKSIEQDKTARIVTFLSQEFRGPFGYKPWFRLLNMSEFDEKSRGSLGSYGFIKGTKNFIAGAAENSEQALVDYGYCFEKILLEMTQLGLGTCWLAGTFKKQAVNTYFKERFDMKPSESNPAISPVGYRSEKPSFIDSAIHVVTRRDQRKPWSELFFIYNKSEPCPEQAAGNYSHSLEAVRLAPSASNAQPWRIFKEAGSDVFHFCLKGGLMLDIGIAMAHFELTAREMGLGGEWIIKEHLSVPQGMKYVASWVGKV